MQQQTLRMQQTMQQQMQQQTNLIDITGHYESVNATA